MVHRVYLVFIGLFAACSASPKKEPVGAGLLQAPAAPAPSYDTTAQTLHVFVALCDNKYQGIVPVPAAIGNGQDPNSNLYWGCSSGIRTYFKKSAHWELLLRRKGTSPVLERLLFRHNNTGAYLVADAFDGRYIKDCTIAFLNACAGRIADTIVHEGRVLGTGGAARLMAYIGHDGLMDFSLPATIQAADQKQRDAIILACISKKYFAPHLRAAGARPLLWTTGLMCPEAYTLHDALEVYLAKGSAQRVREAAARPTIASRNAGRRRP
ncbi:hypothetical protein [Flaviaesturariibacter amylovorans]|uniref:Uncharacterized protein n=1 Tax=Flaviaesturariibacter amylovorans TaxID=1084520 RepID=A0ABP8GXB1_9BACT